nr:histidine phosphatase family protein [Bacillus sp. Y1]
MERPLSEKGYLDALRVTELLIEENIDEVVSSPYKRAIQTVQGTADFFHKKIEIVEECKERLLTTSPAENFTYVITKVWKDYNFTWEGGDSNFVAQKRGIKGIHRILDK